MIDKAAEPGNHNLSGATFQAECLSTLLGAVDRNWEKSEQAKDVLAHKVTKDNVMFLAGDKFAFNIAFSLKLAKRLRITIFFCTFVTVEHILQF